MWEEVRKKGKEERIWGAGEGDKREERRDRVMRKNGMRIWDREAGSGEGETGKKDCETLMLRRANQLRFLEDLVGALHSSHQCLVLLP